ncbi:MAG: guanosine-5'-triphosphate,3'-diphosphate pyrophosphatase, partial [Saprospiraceae bacterium]|nr:guanosine-5'-triphosphate,3'-diphosphate pyrophosphatase [Saprospiraceae bacterium]
MPKHAVIDLGTNTFHLLIAERDPAGAWSALHRDRLFVRLAESGIHHIGPAAYARGLEALLRFRQQLDRHAIAPETVLAYGTAALRTAANASDFLAELRRQTGIRAEVIDGHREAQLIFQGVRQAVPFPDNRVLVMDIGGGSVELILAEGEQV